MLDLRFRIDETMQVFVDAAYVFRAPRVTRYGDPAEHRAREAHAWCVEQFGPPSLDNRDFVRWTASNIYFLFRRPEDGVAFRLRWG